MNSLEIQSFIASTPLVSTLVIVIWIVLLGLFSQIAKLSQFWKAISFSLLAYSIILLISISCWRLVSVLTGLPILAFLPVFVEAVMGLTFYRYWNRGSGNGRSGVVALLYYLAIFGIASGAGRLLWQVAQDDSDNLGQSLIEIPYTGGLLAVLGLAIGYATYLLYSKLENLYSGLQKDTLRRKAQEDRIRQQQDQYTLEREKETQQLNDARLQEENRLAQEKAKREAEDASRKSMLLQAVSNVATQLEFELRLHNAPAWAMDKLRQLLKSFANNLPTAAFCDLHTLQNELMRVWSESNYDRRWFLFDIGYVQKRFLSGRDYINQDELENLNGIIDSIAYLVLSNPDNDDLSIDELHEKVVSLIISRFGVGNFIHGNAMIAKGDS